jgi:hypothetical protein
MISSKRPQETALEKKKEFKKVSKEEQKPVKKFQDYNFISLNTSNISPHGNKEGPGVSSTFEDIRKFSSPQQRQVLCLPRSSRPPHRGCIALRLLIEKVIKNGKLVRFLRELRNQPGNDRPQDQP